MKSKRLLLLLLLAIGLPWTAMAQDPSCTPSFSDPSDDYISKFVTVGGTTNINNSSTYETSGYSNYYATLSASIAAGETLSCTITPSSTSWEYGNAIWVDWNQNNVFDDNERVAYSSVMSGAWTGGIVVSSTTTPGDYYMRIMHSYNADATDPCVSASYGEAEDYKLVVLSAACCPRPTNLACTGYTATTATFTWTNGGEETQWLLEYAMDEDFTNPTQVTVNQSDLVNGEYTLDNNLTTDQQYYARIKAYCPSCDPNYSNASNTCPFKPSASFCDDLGTGTESANLVYTSWGCTYSQHIYTADELTDMGFSAGDIVSVSFYYSGSSSSYQKTQSIYMGTTTKSSYSGYTASDFESEVTLVYGPEQLSYVAGWREYELTEPFTWDGTSNIVIGVLTNGNHSSSSGWSAYGTSTSPDYRTIYRYRDSNPIDITDLASVNNGSMSQIRPNMHLCITPSTKPRNLTVSGISSSGATVTWQAPAGSYPTGYEYQYKTSTGEWPTAWTSNGTNLSVPLSGLTASTSYTFRVRANYAEGNSDPVETDFTTLDNCAFPTNLLAYTTPGQGTKATLTWVKGYDEDAWVLEYATNNTFTEGLVEVTDGFTVEGNNVTANLTGLTAEQTYYARVKANCDGPTSSSWAYFEAFTPTNYVDYTFNENATSNSSYSYIPFRGSYVAYQTNSQFIIPQTSLGDLAGGTVKKLTFYSTSTYANVAWGDASFKVYVAEVDNTTFASNPTSLDWSAMEEVYSGSLSVVNSQMVIELDQEFTYSGTKNLMIGFEKTAVGTNATVAWIYKSASNTCAYSYNSSSATGALSYGRSGYLPKMTFNYRPTATPRPIITVPVTTTDVTATIAWTKPSDNVTGYKYQYKLASATEWPTAWTSLGADAVSVTVPNLTPNTSYDFQMKAVYAEGESVASSTSFATQCGTISVATEAYTFGFEEADKVKFDCWTVLTGSVIRTTGNPHLGSYYLRFSGSQENVIEMPSFEQATNKLRLEYWVRPENYANSSCGSLAIGYYNANNEFVALKTYEYNSTTSKYDGWESSTYIKERIDFDVDTDNDGTPDVPDNANIVFRQFNTTSNYWWFVDDVKVKIIPACDDVENPVCTAQTAHTATLSWTLLDNTQTAWQVAYSTEANFTPNDVTPVDVNSNPATINQLSANTTYYAYVRSNCGSEIYGDWSETYATFTTAIGNPAPTAFHTTDIQQTQVGFDWTNGGGDYEESWMIYLWNESIDINNIADDNLDPSGFRSAGSHPTAIINLTPGTTYYAWVRSNCGSDGMSAWTALDGNSFMTVPTCPAPENLAVTPGSETADGATITWDGTNDSFVVELGTVDLTSPIVTTLLNEGFESGSMPEGWSTEGTKSWAVGAGTGHSSSPVKQAATGNYNVNCHLGSGSSSYYARLITPELDLSNATSATLTFKYANPVWSGGRNSLSIYYRVDGGDWNQIGTTITDYHDSWTNSGEITLPGLAAHYELSFFTTGYSNDYGYGTGIDDITVTMTSYPVIWTVDGTAPNVEDHGSYTFHDLNDLTPYKARVKGICGSSDQSPYSNVVDFTTLEACPTPKDFVLGAVTSRTAAFSWNGGIATGWKVWVKENGETEYPTNYYEVSTPSKTVENLSSNTSYDVKIVPTCDETKALEVLNAFTTGYGIPFVETFETNAIPANWARYTGSVADAFNGTNPSATTNGWSLSNTKVFGEYHASVNIWSNYTYWLTTPNIDLTTATDASKLYLVFDLAITDYNNTTAPGSGSGDEPAPGDDDQFRVLVSTDNGTTWTEDNSWVWMNEGGDYVYSAIPNTGQTIMLPLANYATGSVMIAFYAESGSGTSADFDIHIDNVKVGEVATYQRTIKGHNGGEGGYALVATPVGTIYSFDMANTNMIADPAVDYDLYYFDQSQDLEWLNYKDTEHGGNFNLTTGKGYLYANKNTVNLTFTGIAYSGTGVVDLSYNANAEFAGWNLIGNPYATAATLNKPFYKMNETGDAFTAQIEDLTTTIAAMEGVFVQVTESGQSATFTAQTSKGEQQAIAHTNIVLSGNKGKVLDNAIIRFDNGETLGKFSFRENNAKIYIPMEGKDYAVVNAEGQTGEMPVNFKAEKNGSYNLSFTSQEVSFSYLHLIDNMTGNDVDLLKTPSYTFDATTTDYESRFRLVFATGSSIDGDSFGFINGMGNLCIFGIDGTATVQVVDVTGRMLSSETFSGSYERKLNVAPGVYMIRLINGNDVKVQKMIVR